MQDIYELINLSDIMFESEYVNNKLSQKIMTKLHTTYHVGEDFLDIVDGIRAVDEALLFCGLGRGISILFFREMQNIYELIMVIFIHKTYTRVNFFIQF